ncbi:hypothetical protein MKD41_08160 [Lutibacter sp. A64]|uniref:hypothetical protein n=1 Tax=Lutibacter sp. A64 TaxID=2918526 RepID=UPI001F056302|nr:hypothetical protein [Lutibacter sp. A64]UMB55435.1 hypothetical protein MKD41_08160 [Lutibacter sp. A64]
MKKLHIIFVFILSVFIKLNAQEINVSLNVDTNPNPQISEWVDRAELALLTIVNTNEKYEDYEYKIQTKIYKDDELVAETKANQMPIMYLPFGSETFLADEIVPYNALTFYGSIEKTIIQTGLLPAGMYSFCVSLVDLKGNILTKQESFCKPMIITDYLLPELIYPIENTTILAQNLASTIFTWSPIAPTPPGDEGIKYIIAISEVKDKQTPARAFDVNYPLVEEEIIAGTQFNWPTDIDAPDEDTQYVWSIKPVTFNDNPYKSGTNSFVKIGTFNIKGLNDGSENNGAPTTKSSDVFNCAINPLDLKKDLFFVDTGNSDIVDLHGISAVQNNFWLLVAGTINPAEYQLTTYIDWGCTHSMDVIPYNTTNKTHNYNNFGDNSTTASTGVTVKMELRSLSTGQTCKTEVTISLKEKAQNQEDNRDNDISCNMSDNDFISPLTFTTGYPSEDASVEIYHIDTMAENYMAHIGISDPENYTSYIEVDWGYETTIDEVSRFGESFNYSNVYLMGNNEIPTEICLRLIIRDKKSKDIICEKSVCIPYPSDIQEHLKANWPSEYHELTQNCENFDEEALKNILTFLPQSEEKPNLIQIAGFNVMSMTYMSQLLDGIDPTQFTLFVNVDWGCVHSVNQYDGTQPVIDHNYEDHIADEILGNPTEICITLKLINVKTTEVVCINTVCKEFPQWLIDSFDDIKFLGDETDNNNENDLVDGDNEGNEDQDEGNITETDGDNCACTDEEAIEPELNIFQTEPEDYPRNLTLAGVIAYRDYLLNCNENYSLETHSMTVTLNWGGDFTEESIINSGPFIHEYTIENEIPTEICATFTIAPLFPEEGDEEVSCVTVKCVPVSPELLALNTGVGEGDLTLGESIFAGEHVNGQGEFEIVTTTLEGAAPGPYSGTGTVYIDWIKSDMTVEFTDITIDGDNNLVTGFIIAQLHDTAPTYPVAWLIGMGGGLTFNHEHAEDIMNWIDANTEQEIDYDPATGAVMPVKVPLGLNFPSGDQLAITEMVFRADKSEFNLVAAKTTPPDWGDIQLIGFKALNIEFHPDSPEFPPERMELLEDITIGNINGKITFTFKAPTVDNPGCYIEWNEFGFSNYGVELDANFTREWLIPLPDDGTSKAKANLVATGSAWGDLILIGNLEESVISCTIPDPNSGAPTDSGAHDFIILADNISYDWSDLANAPAIEFPPIYTGETTNLFRGFHMEELTLKFSPNKMNTPEGDPIEISINDMIIDDTGITLESEIENLVVFGDAEVGDMAASIDRIYLEILSSSFVEAGVEGRIAIPVSDGNSMDDSLAYSALFNVPLNPAENKNFQITLTPDQPINADLLKGTMNLDETSNLSGYFDKDKKTFTMDLNGDFTWEDAEIGPVNEINIEIGFEGVGFDYDSSLASNKLAFDSGNWSFASPQKKMANFPVTIEEIEYNEMTTSGNQLLHGKLNFDVIFNLSDKIGGMTTLGAEVAINDESGSGGKKFEPEFIGGIIDSIAISADMAAVKINGAIGFRNDDPVFGDGFIGTLSAEFKGPGIKVGALAEFGNTTYLHSSRYRYWRVEAEATFPAPGITFLPGMAFRGFGGGAFKNMEATLSGSTYTFTPKHSSLGFRAKAVLATTPKEETFNADVGLLGTFSGSGGMTYIGFTGDFYVGASFSTRNKAKVNGYVTVDYDFPQKHFNLSANVNVNAPPITTPSPMSLVLDINGKTNNWYFKFGEPANLNTVNVFGISLYEYLMFGNDIPYPGGFTDTFRTNYHNAVGTYPSAGGASTGGIGSNTASGKGFALGIGFMFDKSGEKELTDYSNGNKKHVLSFDLAAGAELHLSYMQYLGSCNGNTPIGINGWRAKGSLGMYGMAGAGVKKYKKNGSVKWNTNVASLAAGAWITGEFPNPYYVAGAIDGSITVFDLISFNFHKSFEKGTSCNNGGASSGAAVTQGDAAADQENALIQYVHPNTSFNFPTSEPLAVKYGLNPDEVFDVSEQQANGTVEMRTFKMTVSKVLQVKNDDTGAWTTVSLTTNENNLGEFLYTIATPISITAAPATFAPMPPSGGAGGLTVAAAAPVGMAYTAPAGFTPAATPAVGAMVAPSGLMMYPAPGPSDDYDDLPPEPAPVINSLTENKSYRFTVTATLKEWNGSAWTNALKNNGTPVNQTIVKNFRTGVPVLVSGSSGAIMTH